MASTDDIDKLSQDIQQSAGVDASDVKLKWLVQYLKTLPSDQQDAALKRAQSIVSNRQFSDLDDVNWNAQQGAHQAAQSSQNRDDPASRLGDEDQQKKLKDYFNGDSDIKGKKELQSAIVDQLIAHGSVELSPDDVVDQAKGIHFNIINDKSSTFYNPELAASYQTKGSASDTSFLNEFGQFKTGDLDKYLGKLDSTTKRTVLQQLSAEAKSKAGGGLGGWLFGTGPKGSLKQSDIDQMVKSAHQYAADSLARQGKVDDAKKQLLSGQTFSDQKAQQTASQDAKSATPTDPGSDPLVTKTGATTVSQDQKDQYKLITGQDFDQAYQAFSGSYVIAVQQHGATGFFGSEQLWTGGAYNPNSGTWSFNTPLSINDPKIQADMQKTGHSAADYKPSEAQFLAMQNQASGPLAVALTVEQQAKSYWDLRYPNQDFPQDLTNQIYQTISHMSPDQLAREASSAASGGSTNTATAGASLATGLVTGAFDPTQTGGTAIDQIVRDYVSSHPDLTKQSTDAASKAAALKVWQSSFGNTPPPPGVLDKLAGMSSADQTDFINAQPKPGAPNGMTLGQYANVEAMLKSAGWNDAFGNTDPTPQQIYNASKWTKQDATQYINAAPSQLDGINYGQYKAYQTAGDKFSTDLLGHPMDASTIQELHQLASAPSKVFGDPGYTGG